MPKAMGLLGYKVGMTQVFNDDGTIEPVTVIRFSSDGLSFKPSPSFAA